MTNYEKIPLFIVYRENSFINAEQTPDCMSYELLGFLKCYVKLLEEKLIDNLDNPKD